MFNLFKCKKYTRQIQVQTQFQSNCSIFASCHLDSFINSIAAGAIENATERYKQLHETEIKKNQCEILCQYVFENMDLAYFKKEQYSKGTSLTKT